MSGAEPAVIASLLAATATAGTGYVSYKASQKKAPELPTPSEPKAMPVKDDEAARRERLRAIASLSNTSGRASTFLTSGRLGDDTDAPGRGGMAMG